MQDWLSARAAASPDKLALVTMQNDTPQAVTYGVLQAEVSRLCARLEAAGVQPGDHLGVLLPNSPAYVRLIHAVLRMGIVLVPLNVRLTGGELGWQVAKAACRWLVHDKTTAALVSGLAGSGLQVLAVEELAALPAAAEAVRHWSQGIVDLEVPLAVVFTSGTSGRPKGAVLAVGSFFYSAMASAYRLGVAPSDRWLCVLPLYHVGGLSIILRSCLYGTAVDLVDRFEVQAVNQALHARPVTLVSLVPTMLYRLLESGAYTGWSKSLRLVLLGGAAAAPELLARCQKEGVPVALTYGLTEAASQVATMIPADVLRKPGSVGRPLLFTSVRVVNEAGQSVPAGTYGEIIISGPTVMQGYLDDEAATASVLRDGWLHTGDIGYLDDDGDLWLVQRRSDLIISGGENVYPVEVEAVLRQHPAVRAVCVVGIPHPEWGQQVAAAVELVEATGVGEEALVTFARQYLAGYKQPRAIRFVRALPRTASGKIQRERVVELF